MRQRFLWQIIGTLGLLASLIVFILWGLRHDTAPSQKAASPDSAVAQGSLQTHSTSAGSTASHPPSGATTQVGAAATFPGLAVKGSQIITGDQRPITLIGATRSSLEYLCTGDGHFQASDFLAMRAWGMNVVRLTLSSEFWANHDNACPTYRQTVHDAVMTAEAQGLYVILTLQWNAPLDSASDRTHGGAQCPMPDARQDVAFWQDVAASYRTDQHVLFDLFGEPHDVSWKTWYDGGTIVGGCDVIQQTGSSVEQGTYTAIGMGALSDIVHTIAPANTLIVSGLDWGYDLSQVTAYPLATTNILYDTHPFDYGEKQPAYWDHAFGNLARHAAVIAGEFGSYDCQTTYSAQLIAYFNQHHISWLAWAWNPSACSGPSLIADWTGTPSTPYGAYIHEQMLAASALNAAPQPNASPQPGR